MAICIIVYCHVLAVNKRCVMPNNSCEGKMPLLIQTKWKSLQDQIRNAFQKVKVGLIPYINFNSIMKDVATTSVF